MNQQIYVIGTKVNAGGGKDGALPEIHVRQEGSWGRGGPPPVFASAEAAQDYINGSEDKYRVPIPVKFIIA